MHADDLVTIVKQIQKALQAMPALQVSVELIDEKLVMYNASVSDVIQYLSSAGQSWHLTTTCCAAGMPIEPCMYKAIVAYDGSAYKGFQLQSEADSKKITIQGELEACLVRMFQVDRRVLRVQGAGRTDSGVHARGQA